MTIRPLVTASLLAIGGWLLYAPHVATMPPSLADDEVVIALTAHSIATTGKDLTGQSWPLYIQITAGSWFHPVIVYSIALALQVLPLSEQTIRLPTVAVGVANIVLMYFVARVLFRREVVAVLAAVLLALTPTHFLHSRFALEYLYPLPFVSAWLLCLFTYLERNDPRWLVASTFVLGLGSYSYIGALVLMPVYVLLTGLALVLGKKPVRAYAMAAAGFLIPLAVLFVPWFLTHRSAFDNTLAHYEIYDARRLNPVQGVRELLSYSSVAARTTVYWSFLNPSFLFLDLTAPSLYSTRTTGVFLLPLLLFLPVGLYQACRSREARQVVVVLGFLSAPLAAVFVGEAFAIGRSLELLPFGVLLALIGVVYLWSAPGLPLRRVCCLAASALGFFIAVGYSTWTLLTEGRIGDSTPLLLAASFGLAVVGLVSDRSAWRILVVASLLAGLVQFQRYRNDYFTEYRERASDAFLRNRGGGLEHIIERSRGENIPAIYLGGLSRDVEVALQHWRFYLIKHGAEELLPRTVIVEDTVPVDFTSAPPKSAILGRASDQTLNALVASGELTLEALVPEPSGQPFFAVFRR